MVEKKPMNGNGWWKATSAFLGGALIAAVSGYFAFDFRYGDAIADVKVIQSDMASIRADINRIESNQASLFRAVNSMRLTVARAHPELRGEP